ncbi:MAG: CUB domain-containing protein, partial [Bacteroidia bacterium]
MKIYILRRILLLSCLLMQFALGAQIYILGEGPSTILTCGGTILDPGGEGDYNNNIDVMQTICPEGIGESVQLSFTTFGTEACCDELIIYEGPNESGATLGVWAGANNPGIITGSASGNGCLTLNFSADLSIVGSGFEALISCIPSMASIALGEGSDTLYGCSFIITDPGGVGNYEPNENVVQTFCSESGQCVRLDFQLLNTEAGLDVLKIYDGPSTGSQLLATFSDNISNPNPVQSSIASEGCLTLEFTSNDTIQFPGFRASILCTPCEMTPIIFGQDQVITVCDGVILDPGGYSNYPLNSDATQTICSDNGECVKLVFTEFSTAPSADVLRIYDGPDTSADIIGIFSGTPFFPPGPLSSSIESDGCITMEFSSNASSNMSGFEVSISCIPCSLPLELPTGFCQDALPFCSSDGLYFPAAINTQSEFGLGI